VRGRVVMIAALAFAGISCGGGDEKLPASLDWRNNGGNFVTSTSKEQGQCDSCWAFAATAMTESYYAITNKISNPTIDLSQQTLISCAQDGSCTYGGNIGQALDFIRDQGLPDESCFPYKGQQEDCGMRCADWASGAVKIPGWTWVDEDKADDEAIKRALMSGPVTAYFHEDSTFDAYTGGVYECPGERTDGNHFVLLIGWDDSAGAWIAKNSYGPGWGENGFFRIAYCTCGIGQWVAQVTGASAGTDPQQ
jgi:C1A family cysteine protease